MIEERIDKLAIRAPFEQRQVLFSCLLEQDITADTAVQIALLNNPEIQALFEEIGIAKSELWQAVLFLNPVFDAAIRYPLDPLAIVNLQAAALQNIVDILLVPLRKQIACAELERTQYHVADAILNLAFDVKDAYYHLIAETRALSYLSLIVDGTDAVNELAMAQRRAGNINDLELRERQTAFIEAKIAYGMTERDVIEWRERLYSLLGLSSSCVCLNFVEDFPCMPECEPTGLCLDDIALSSRLDLAVERAEIKRILRMRPAKEWWTYTEGLFGFSFEREPEGTKVIGPAFSFALPIFDSGQAARAELFHKYRKHVEHLKAAEIETLAEVHAASALVSLNREIAIRYFQELIPLRESLVSTGQKFYNVMAFSIYVLLDKKIEELRAEMNYIFSLRDYWLSRVALERAIGGDLNLLCVP